MKHLLQLDYEKFKATRDFLQDVAKVLGKVQQVFIKAQPHEWHKGLEIAESGLQTQKLSNGKRITLDLHRGVVQAGKIQWLLTDYSAQQLFIELAAWAKSNGAKKVPNKPEFATKQPRINSKQTKALANALLWVQTILRDVKKDINTGTTSPILLYPHHFDLSLVWFPNNDDTQLGLGFSTGDVYIAKPYFYIISYPEL